MKRIMLKSKIHSAVITETKLEYEGSITIDSELLEAADLLPGEKVHVLNFNNGSRMETYIIKGRKGSREICLNGPAALKGEPGDRIIVIAYTVLEDEDAREFKPTIVFVDKNNNIKEIKKN